jgi:hypothetical protein
MKQQQTKVASVLYSYNDLSRKAQTGRTKTEHKRILYIRKQKQTNATLNFFQVLVYPYI